MIHAVSPWGEAIWFVDRTVPSTSTGATFRLVSMSPAGDTLVDRRVPYEPLPLADAYFADLVRGITENALAGGIPAGMVREAREALATQAFRPDFHPPVTRLVGGVDSTIWVGREEVSDSVPWDVFDHTGSQVGSLLLARRVVVHRASRRAIWTVVAGQFGEPHVIRWRIEDAM